MSGFDVEATRKQVRNVNLRIRRDGSVALSAPLRMPWAEVERFVESRAEWIETRRAEVEAARPRIRWREGECVALWGEPLTLAVATDAGGGRGRAERRGDHIVLHVCERDAMDEKERQAYRASLFDALLSEEIARELATLLPSCEQRVGRRASKIRLRRMTSRWGSCNVGSGNITLNLELGERPKPCLEAVLCHELCHLHERGHNARFYAHLDRALPTWRDAHGLLDRPPRAPR